MHSVSKNPLIATFQLSSAASSNLGQSQNGVLGNGLNVRLSGAIFSFDRMLYKKKKSLLQRNRMCQFTLSPVISILNDTEEEKKSVRDEK